MSSSFLIFTLAAPLASFGEVAGHERRGSRERPGKSAILGLVGAALGIRRDDGEAQEALRTGYDMAVRVDNPGTPLQDYHTVQAVAGDKKLHPRTRADALKRGKRKTIITRRDYRIDVHYHIAIAARPSARWSLDELIDALRRPRFTLYLGRKSCPLSLPLDPWLLEANDILQALQKTDKRQNADKQRDLQSCTGIKTAAPPYVALSRDTYDALIDKPDTNPRFETVNDEPIDRIGWHFTAHREAVLVLVKHDDEVFSQETSK